MFMYFMYLTLKREMQSYSNFKFLFVYMPQISLKLSITYIGSWVVRNKTVFLYTVKYRISHISVSCVFLLCVLFWLLDNLLQSTLFYFVGCLNNKGSLCLYWASFAQVVMHLICSWLRFIMVFPSTCRQMMGYCLKLCHDNVLPQFII
jgi:hypothetical protein